MNAVGAAAALLMMLIGPAAAFAQSAKEEILLTAGVVKRVDAGARTIVLENGRILRPRAILLNDEWVDISVVQPKDAITLSGIDLGREGVQASVRPR